MGYAAWLLVVAAGAILRYAVNDTVSGIDLHLVGLILMIVGIVGFVISLLVYLTRTRRRDYVAPGSPYPPVEP